MASHPPKDKWKPFNWFPKRFRPAGIAAAGMLLPGTGEFTDTALGQAHPTTGAKNDTVIQTQVQSLIIEIQTHLKYTGEGKRKADPNEIEMHIKALGSEAYNERDNAHNALCEIGLQARAELRNARQTQDLEVRRRVEQILKNLKPTEDKRAAKLLGPVRSLATFGANAKDAVPLLIEVLAEEDKTLKHAAAWTLGFIGPGARAAVPALIELLKDTDASTDQTLTAAHALGSIGPGAKAAVPVLMTTLKHKNEWVRFRVATTLGDIGPEAKEAVPGLIDTLKANEYNVREAAAIALGKIGPEANAAVSGLIVALTDVHYYVRVAAATALGSINLRAKAAVPGLSELLNDEQPVVRQASAEALGKFGPEAKAAVPALIKVLKEWPSSVTLTAVTTLGKIGPEAKEAIPALQALRDAKLPKDEVGTWWEAEIRRRTGAAIEAIEKRRGR